MKDEKTNTALAEIKPPSRRKQVSDLLVSMKSQIAMALPKHITPDKMIRTAVTSFSKNPKLLDCTDVSLLACIMEAAQLGLVPDGVLGQAYLIPFKNTKKGITECQFIPGYKGLIALAMRSNEVSSFQGRIVYDSDFFEYEYGIDDKLIHRPSGKRGEITHAYAVLKFKNGGRMFEVMTIEELNYIRDTSANYQASQRFKFPSTWDTYKPEMCIKTVIRKLSKYAPLSPEFQRATTLDEQAEILGTPQKLQYELTEIENIPDKIKNAVEVGISEDAEEVKAEEIENVKTEKTEKVNSTTDKIISAMKGESISAYSGFQNLLDMQETATEISETYKQILTDGKYKLLDDTQTLTLANYKDKLLDGFLTKKAGKGK